MKTLNWFKEENVHFLPEMLFYQSLQILILAWTKKPELSKLSADCSCHVLILFAQDFWGNWKSFLAKILLTCMKLSGEVLYLCLKKKTYYVFTYVVRPAISVDGIDHTVVLSKSHSYNFQRIQQQSLLRLRCPYGISP